MSFLCSFLVIFIQIGLTISEASEDIEFTNPFNVTILNYDDESEWPPIAQHGFQQSPIDFNLSSEHFVKLGDDTEIMYNTYHHIYGIKLEVVNDAKFRFIQDHMGALFFKKFGVFYQYDLFEIHFHYPSEHSFNGERFAMEMHMVHIKNHTYFYEANPTYMYDPDERNQRLVVAILYKTTYNDDSKVTQNNSFIDCLNFATIEKVDNFTLNQYVTSDRFFYMYDGGLTTPPSIEFVNFIVMTQFEYLTEDQLKDFRILIRKYGGYESNSRKTQEYNGRTIYYKDPTVELPDDSRYFSGLGYAWIFLILIYM